MSWKEEPIGGAAVLDSITLDSLNRDVHLERAAAGAIDVNASLGGGGDGQLNTGVLRVGADVFLQRINSGLVAISANLGGSGNGALLAKGLTGNGTSSTVGYLRFLEDVTGNNTLAPGETWKVFTNAGAGGTTTHTLLGTYPAGYTATFYVLAAFELRIDPAAGDKILDLDMTGLVDGEYVVSSTVKSTITLVKQTDGDWLVTDKRGTWTEQTP